MFTEIKESLRQLYLEDARPWLVGSSGGNVKNYYDYPHADTFRRDLHPDLRVDYVLANPPFNVNAAEQALKDGMEEESKEFAKKGNELYVKA